MPADLDQYADPPRDEATLKARRLALLDQLGWLEDEAAALAPLLGTLPAWAVDQAPLPTDLTAKETFAALAALDRDVYPVWIRRLQDEDTPEVAMPDPLPGTEGANDRALDDLLDDLRQSRRAFRETVESVPAEAWLRPVVLGGEQTDLYGLTLTIVRHDADHLKELAYRLHSADLRIPKP